MLIESETKLFYCYILQKYCEKNKSPQVCLECIELAKKNGRL